jgi:hypothetical protein
MSWSCLPRWKFTDSCGRPRASGAIHVGCAHVGHTACAVTTRRAFLKTGVAIVGGGGLASVMDPREVFAQVRVFPPPPPAVSPIAGLMDTHVHSAPDVFGRSLDDEEVAILYKDRGLEALVLKNHVLPTADRAWFAKLELCAMGTLMGPEAHLGWMRNWRRVKVEETAAAVKEVGAQNFILATDLGQTGNPSPADGLQLFVTDLMKAGVSKDQIMTMGREVTGKLLMG